MFRSLLRRYRRARLADPSYQFLFDPVPSGEWVAIDCETTGLDQRRDEIIAVAAIRVRNNRILTSEAYQAIVRSSKLPSESSIKVHQLRAREVAEGRDINEVLSELLHFIRSRPIVGYYTAFDLAMLNKSVVRLIGTKLPNQRIDISEIYYALKFKGAPPGTVYDLRFAAILSDLGLPRLDQHNAFNDALMTAMMYLQLQDMADRGIRISTGRVIQQAVPVGA